MFDYNIDISMNTTECFRNTSINYNKSYASKENEKNYFNISLQKNIFDSCKYNKYTSNEQNIRTSIYNSFMNGIKPCIETKSINLASLYKSNNSNFQRYNASTKNEKNHGKLNSSNFFNNSSGSHDGNIYSNQSLGSHYIHW